MENRKLPPYESKEKKSDSRPTTIFSAERVFRVGAVQAVGIVFTTFVTGFAGSLLVRFNTAVSLPGRVDAHEEAIISVKKSQENFVNKDVYKSDIDSIKQTVRDLKGSIDQLISLQLSLSSRQ